MIFSPTQSARMIRFLGYDAFPVASQLLIAKGVKREDAPLIHEWNNGYDHCHVEWTPDRPGEVCVVAWLRTIDRPYGRRSETVEIHDTVLCAIHQCLAERVRDQVEKNAAEEDRQKREGRIKRRLEAVMNHGTDEGIQ